MVMQWIQDNVAVFGGNPAEVYAVIKF